MEIINQITKTGITLMGGIINGIFEPLATNIPTAIIIGIALAIITKIKIELN